jgi:hypothetical protein
MVEAFYFAFHTFLVAVTIFGVEHRSVARQTLNGYWLIFHHRFNDGFTYGQSFWITGAFSPACGTTFVYIAT